MRKNESRSLCEKQDIKHVRVCGSSANFPQKTYSEKITQNKENKMSDKTEVPDKSKTPDKLEIDGTIRMEPQDEIFTHFPIQSQQIYGDEKEINVIVYPPTETFIPPTHTINESAPEFKLCIDDILCRIKIMGPVVDSNEAMRKHWSCRYAIKKITKQNQATVGICQNLLQCRSACDMNIDMNKKKRKVDEALDPDYDHVFGIVGTGTDWYFILHSTDGIYTSRTEVGGSEEPTTKKRRVEEKIKKK
ncbi:hypothetical protein GLOIN_2v1725482 [Rhizophagus clarus]|uniref:Uncharacterized protein n=1 Tax=Rhizophagus clarus TaxID=94130 RepID=A0A8H3LM17_9GLOM|nr:hypothetical protein GLOIN_2v1725482 [Rhizophagus clarus]